MKQSLIKILAGALTLAAFIVLGRGAYSDHKALAELRTQPQEHKLEAVIIPKTNAVQVNGRVQQDFDSIVTGDLSAREWIDTTNLLFTSPYNSSDGTFADLVQINANFGAVAASAARGAFSVPSGTTSVTFSSSCLEANSKAYRLTIFASDGTTDLGHTDCTTAPATLTACSVTVSVSSGNLYWAALLPDVSAQEAAPACQRVQIKPTGATGVFSGDFLRIRASLELLAGSYGQEHCYGCGYSYPFSNPQSDMTIVTNATRIAAELATQAGSGSLAWFIGGRPYQQVNSLGSATTYAYSDIALPTSSPARGAGQPQTVMVRDDAGQLGTGNFLVAMYISLPATYLEVPRPRLTQRRAVIYGDSIEGGYYAGGIGGPNLIQGWPSLFKEKFPGIVTIEQYSGRQFYTDTNNGTTANEQSFAQTITQLKPTDVILAIGTNDYAPNGLTSDATWTAASFGTAYAAVLDDIHAYDPGARVWCISPIHRTTETANNLGNTLGDFRTQINTACTAGSRSPWSNFIDGTQSNMPQTGNLVDGVHPNAEGHAMYARTVEHVMGLGGYNISGGRPAAGAGIALLMALTLLRRRSAANDAASDRQAA